MQNVHWHVIGNLKKAFILDTKSIIMKKQLLAVAIAGSLAVTGCSVEGGYVESQPADIVYTRPLTPGPDYIWIDGDWVWSGGGYRWHQGHWDRPRSGRAWTAGHWDHSGRGYHWTRGHY
jgi:hypothetical protein